MIPVQYIISTRQKLSVLAHVETAIQTGCKWIQLQGTEGQDKKLVEITTKIKNICRENDVTFIIENNIELVKAIEADGVHLTNGMSVIEARQLLGEGFLIGINAHNAEEIASHKRQSADYICYGPFSGQQGNEPDCEGLTLSEFVQTMNSIIEQEISLPICAFGKIGPDDVMPIMHTGIRGISISLAETDIDKKTVKAILENYLSI